MLIAFPVPLDRAGFDSLGRAARKLPGRPQNSRWVNHSRPNPRAMIQFQRRTRKLRFVTIQRDGYTEPGVLLDGRVIPIHGAGLSTVLEVIAGGAGAQGPVRRWGGGAPPPPS